jgi:hypothetical protein
MTMPRRCTAGLIAAVMAIVLFSSLDIPARGRAGGPSVTDRRCFGAAARAQWRHPCHDRRLRYVVRPRPVIAQLTPNWDCDRLPRFGPVSPCAFGVGPRRAVRTIALTGDSHASHWRAAVDFAADHRRWHGLSITNGICPVSRAIRQLPQPELGQCLEWNAKVLEWLGNNPEISTLFQSQIVSSKDVSAAPGESQFAAKVRGYIEEWKALPPSVKHVIVLRDPPTTNPSSAGCVMRARAKRLRPGIACAESRARHLRPDPLAVAARLAPRVHLVDLTRFMCNRRKCFPVVGGALVHKDTHHLTRVFARTLGPFLLRRVKDLGRRWRD